MLFEKNKIKEKLKNLETKLKNTKNPLKKKIIINKYGSIIGNYSKKYDLKEEIKKFEQYFYQD